MRVIEWIGGFTPRFWMRAGIALAIIVAGIVAYKVIDRSGQRTVAVAKQSGATGAVAAGQAQTLDQLKDANDAESDLKAAGERDAARYAECLQNSRNKPACGRYNPEPR